MITMYASVASRTAEIGTLRALGFSRGSILIAFLGESLLLGLLGGVIGLVCAAFMQALSISTTNFQTFAEIAFRFALTPDIVARPRWPLPSSWDSSAASCPQRAPRGSRSSMR